MAAIGGLFLLVFAVFWPCLSLGFVYDDAFRMEELPFLNQNPARALLRPRGLTYAFHLLDYRIWGDQAFGYHLTNLMLHALAVLSVYALIFTWRRRFWLALLTAAFFAVNPIHLEVVVSFVNRKDILAFIGIALGLTLLLRAPAKSPSHLFFAGCCFAAAFAAKEIAVVGVFLFGVWYQWQAGQKPFNRPNLQKPWVLGALFALPLLLAVALAAHQGLFQNQAVRELYGGEIQHYGGVLLQVLANLPVQLHQVSGYGNLAAEYPLRPDYDRVAYAFVGGLLLLLFAGLIIFRQQKQIAAIAAAWFFLTWLPTANFIPLTPYFLADRYLYTPSLAAALVFAHLVLDVSGLNPKKNPTGFATITGLFLATFIGISFLNIKHWQSEEALWQNAIKEAGSTYRAHVILGSLAMQANRIDEAETHYKEALIIRPNVYETHLRLMLVYAKNDRFTEALPHAERVLNHIPNQAEALRVTGMQALLDQRYADAVQPFRKLFGQEPGRADVANNLAWLLSAAPDPNLHSIKEAIIYAEKAVAASNSTNPAYLYTLAVALARDQRGEEALSRLQQAKTLAEAQGNQRLLDQINRLLAGPQ
ncbi:tetratricopeptide repeat protein [Acanthopleuribacter pedis]|uniref:Uncharacterized protein n=1 Tax=Acanthopleuribacter pedis TaxID=442870 RepID=A0A8J7Q2M5_9BACT|nr:tetratricopeptide repeat protein [Acanthopleuribacter pedis]MBO1318135.1 hypothetical protein [Acanthopleuribacter pedis]